MLLQELHVGDTGNRLKPRLKLHSNISDKPKKNVAKFRHAFFSYQLVYKTNEYLVDRLILLSLHICVVWGGEGAVMCLSVYIKSLPQRTSIQRFNSEIYVCSISVTFPSTHKSLANFSSAIAAS